MTDLTRCHAALAALEAAGAPDFDNALRKVESAFAEADGARAAALGAAWTPIFSVAPRPAYRLLGDTGDPMDVPELAVDPDHPDTLAMFLYLDSVLALLGGA